MSSLKKSTLVPTWPSLDAFRPVTAEIRYADDGGPARTILHGRLTKRSGIYPSTKSRTPLPWEALEERSRLMTSEVDTNIVQICTQPHLLIIFERGKRHAFYPDIAERTSSEAIQIVEMKNKLSEIKANIEYAHKLDLAESVYKSLGWEFIKSDKKIIEHPSVRFNNIKQLHDLGRLRIEVEHRVAVQEVFARSSGRSVELGSIAEALGGWKVGVALAGAMMVRRHLRIDLDWPLSPGSVVTPVAGREEFRLRPWPWQEVGCRA